VLSRLRKATEEKDQGFTLIELLVVMIIIGILAAIAIPVFLSQRAKAQDSATKADVSTVGKGIATYYVDGDGAGVLAIANSDVPSTPTSEAVTKGHYTLTVGTSTRDLGKASNNVTVKAGANTNITKDTAWCVGLTNSKGSQKDWKYSAANGLEQGVCNGAV